MLKIIIKITLIFFLYFNTSFSEVVNKIEIKGNKRISAETIKIFGDIRINEDYDNIKLNKIIKNLFKTEFFEDINIKLSDGILKINVIENPIIQNVEISGVKNKGVIKVLNQSINLKEKSSFVKNKVKADETILKNILKTNGYYFSSINTKIEKNVNDTINLYYEIDLGEKAYIKNIKFIGDKKIKDRKLKNVIVSEEAKFWKFISNRKFLDYQRIKLDENLLRNYYKNNGYYDVRINSTFAQIVDDTKFEVVFNIDAGNKFFFNNLYIEIPPSFESKNFLNIKKVLNKLKGKTYSLSQIEKILKEIDKIVLQKQFQFLNASYNEVLENNLIDLTIKIQEDENKYYVEKVNIFGNYITNENVIRNQLINDEGDPYNEILFKRSINNIKARNIFGKVKSSIDNGSEENLKIINIEVEERPTGEIAAGAGTGTSGSNISLSISENNYLGKGIRLKANAAVSDNSVDATLSITNPNFNNSNKSLNTTIENSTSDLMSKYGYETQKTGFSFGTSFQQYQDIFFSPSISTYFESLDTSADASAAKKKQEGDYFDTNFSYSLTLNKLNQNFQPSDGYKSSFFQSFPILADDKSIINSYEYSTYNKLGNDSVISFIFFTKAINSLDDDVRVSKRIFIPSRKLRGFASGKVGPKDGGDYIGGNYGSAINVAATLPKLFVDLQNVDLSIFFDTANVWGVDYNSSLDSNKIRSASGIAVDWFTPIGPLSFSLATPITKSSTDKTESFRFQLGTTF